MNVRVMVGSEMLEALFVNGIQQDGGTMSRYIKWKKRVGERTYKLKKKNGRKSQRGSGACYSTKSDRA